MITTCSSAASHFFSLFTLYSPPPPPHLSRQASLVKCSNPPVLTLSEVLQIAEIWRKKKKEKRERKLRIRVVPSWRRRPKDASLDVRRSSCWWWLSHRWVSVRIRWITRNMSVSKHCLLMGIVLLCKKAKLMPDESKNRAAKTSFDFRPGKCWRWATWSAFGLLFTSRLD